MADRIYGFELLLEKLNEQFNLYFVTRSLRKILEDKGKFEQVKKLLSNNEKPAVEELERLIEDLKRIFVPKEKRREFITSLLEIQRVVMTNATKNSPFLQKISELISFTKEDFKND